MRKCYFRSFGGLAAVLALQAFISIVTAQVAFTGGNLLVEKVGNGSVLSNKASRISADEYTTSGILKQSIHFDNGSNITLTAVGNDADEGFPSLSPDGLFVIFPGYSDTIGTPSVAGGSHNRQFGYANANGGLSIPVLNLSFLNGGSFRSATTDGFNWYGAGAAGYIYVNSSGAVAASPLGTTGTRCVAIYNGQLFYSTASGVAGVYQSGTGLPSNGLQPVTLIAASTNPNQFAFNPAHDILYIADEGSAAGGGGIKKYVYSAATSLWVLKYTLNNNGTARTACRGLTVDWSGTSPVIYATEATASSNRLLKVTDNGSALSTVQTNGIPPAFLATAAANYRFAGLTFAPATPSIALYNFLSGTVDTTSVAPYNTYTDSYITNDGPVATATTSFLIKGYYLSNNIIVTASAGFQVSTSATAGFAGSVQLVPVSDSVLQRIYVRMTGGLAEGNYSGNVIVNTTGCPQYGAVSVMGSVGNQWTGNYSSAWGDGRNWFTNRIPTGATDVSIPVTSRNPIISGHTAVKNIHIATGATVTMSNVMLTVNGQVTGTGTFAGLASSGLTLAYSGDIGTLYFAAQGINSLILSGNSATATLGNATNIAGELNIGSAALNTGGNLTLKSTINGTAWLAPVNGGSVTGNVTVERYIPQNAFRAWRLLSVPVHGTQTFHQAW